MPVSSLGSLHLQIEILRESRYVVFRLNLDSIPSIHAYSSSKKSWSIFFI